MWLKTKSGIVSLALTVCLFWIGFRIAHDHWTVGIAAEREIPLYLDEYLGPAVLSPDGSRLLVGRHQKAVSGSNVVASSFETYDSKTAGLLSTIPMPTFTTTTPGSGDIPLAVSGFGYCDSGKFVVARLGISTFGVLDGNTLQLLSRISLPAVSQQQRDSVILSNDCAANSSYMAFEFTGPQSTGITKVFDLSDGSQVAEISEDLSRGRLMNLAMSPSGTAAAVLVGNKSHPDEPPPAGFDLLILDLQSHHVSKWIQTGMAGKQAVFVGDSTVAVVSDTRVLDSDRPGVRLFDIQTGKMIREFAARGMVIGPPISVSADGARLLAYTGDESTNEHGRQIRVARFTVWDTRTAKIVAQSGPLPVLRTADASSMFGGLMPWAPTKSWSPQIQLNQAGDTALVEQESEPLEVFTFKSK